MTRVAVLGSTGSIGRNTLDVIARAPDRLRLVGLAARSRVESLAAQVAQLGPAQVAVWDETAAQAFERLTGRRPLAGPEGLVALATDPQVDLVVVAMSGRDGLVPLIRAIDAGKRIALASKELLVIAGDLIMQRVRTRGTTLVPVDSEHAALCQCLEGVAREHIASLTVTGSGGPLRTWSAEAIATAPREQVLAHPKWRMGPKITVDSATLMNKGLELIEARWLFDLPLERLRVLIHPEAIVHALVELVDGTTLAQLSPCDMRLPIQYALCYPERWANALPRLSWTQLPPLRFFEPDLERFPCLRLACRAAAEGPGASVVLNAANEVAVQAYLEGGLAFGDVPRVIEESLGRPRPVGEATLEERMKLDRWARASAAEAVHQWLPR